MAGVDGDSEFGARAHTGLAVDPGQVPFNGLRADAELVGDLGVAAAARGEECDPLLAARQRKALAVCDSVRAPLPQPYESE